MMSRSSSETRVWDPLVRIFHWSLVAGVLVAWISADEWDRLHEWSGYAILGLIAIRVLWGFCGSRYARFSDFVQPPARVLGYLKEVVSLGAKRYLGHNPAGGYMVVLLLLMLVLTGATGYPLSPEIQLDEGWIREGLEGVHEFLANLTLFLVVVHVCGVVVTSLMHGENLVRAMVNGRKRRD